MSDDDNTINVDIPAEFPIMIADGAYTHYREGYVKLQFYIEKSFPVHHQSGSVIYEDRERELIHEVRLPYEDARRLGMDLVNGTHAFSEYVANANRLVATLAHSELSDSSLEANAVLKYFEARHKLMVYYLRLNAEGQKQYVEIINKFFSENAAIFAKLETDYPAELKKKSATNG